MFFQSCFANKIFTKVVKQVFLIFRAFVNKVMQIEIGHLFFKKS